MKAKGFWSYVHQDDEAEHGRIAQLARDVVAQYEMITGEAIELFLDRDSLEWGEEWRSKVDASLASVAFFIPVLTPRYFKSGECRRELNYFARQAASLGVRELVMPILYVDVAGLHDDPPADEAMALVKPFQWEDWTELRFTSPTSPEYRTAVSKLATRLAEANAAAEQVDVSAAAIALAENGDDEELGIIDRIGRAEEAMPQWAETVVEIGQEIERIGAVMQAAVVDLNRSDAQGEGFASRLVVARRLAGQLREPTTRITNFGEQFARQLNEVDQGIRLLIERIPDEARENPDSLSIACEFFSTMRAFADSADQGLGSLKEMIDAMSPIEGMSRDLRRPIRELRQGLTLMYEGRQVIRSWVAMIDSSSLDCAEPST